MKRLRSTKRESSFLRGAIFTFFFWFACKISVLSNVFSNCGAGLRCWVLMEATIWRIMMLWLVEVMLIMLDYFANQFWQFVF